jgi:hypothetical protein
MESIMVHFRFPQASSMLQGRKKKKKMTTNRLQQLFLFLPHFAVVFKRGKDGDLEITQTFINCY